MEKLYVLVRKDLSVSQQAVQAGHAVAEYLLHGPRTNWKNGTLVYLGVRNKIDLEYWTEKFDRKNIEWVGFREPDMADELTAVSVIGNDRVFNKLDLL
jgi:hypothetical protein